MELEFDQRYLLQEPSLDRPKRDYARPDWAGLRARLDATREAWRVVAAMDDAERRKSAGSFDRLAASILSDQGNGLAPINLNASGNRNPDGDIKAYVAGPSRTGDRG